MPTLGWGSEIPREKRKVTKILLVDREPDSLSDAERAELARVYGPFEAVRVNCASIFELTRISREHGGVPIVDLSNKE